MVADNKLLAAGIYTLPEAARLAGISLESARRWTVGYKGASGKRHQALFERDFDWFEERAFLSFLDLVELYFVGQFSAHNVPTNQIRAAAQNAANLLGSTHPFASLKFGAIGRQVVLLDDDGLVDVATLQNEMHSIVEDHLKYFDIEMDEIQRWWPMGPDRSIVVDPKRSFGAPTVGGRVPAATILERLAAGDPPCLIADLYHLGKHEIDDVVEWGQRLRPAA